MRIRTKLNWGLFLFLALSCVIATAARVDLVNKTYFDTDGDGSGPFLDEDRVTSINQWYCNNWPDWFHTTFVHVAGDDMTGALFLPNGGLTSPSLSFTSDRNTGLYWLSADTMALITGGTARLTFGSAGGLQWNTANSAGFIKNDASGNLSFGNDALASLAVSYPLHFSSPNLTFDADYTMTTATLNATFAPISHNQAAETINSGTLDGDRLPAMSETKKGAVPATGTPSGLFLSDSGFTAVGNCTTATALSNTDIKLYRDGAYYWRNTGNFANTGDMYIYGTAVFMNSAQAYNTLLVNIDNGSDADLIIYGHTPGVTMFHADVSNDAIAIGCPLTQSAGASTFNATLGDYDFRVHGDTISDVIWVDAGSDTVHLGPTTQGSTFTHTSGTVTLNSSNGAYDFAVNSDNVTSALAVDGYHDEVQIQTTLLQSGGATTFNSAKGDYDFLVHGDSVDNALYVDAGNARVGIRTASPGVELQIDKTTGGPQMRLSNSNTFSTGETVLGTIDATGKYTSGGDIAALGYMQILLDAGASGNRESSLCLAPYDGATAIVTRFYADYGDGGPQICFNNASPMTPAGDPLETYEMVLSGGIYAVSAEGMQSWYETSTRDIKTDIRDVTSATAWTLLDQLQPRRFAMRRRIYSYRLPDGKIVSTLDGVKEADAARAEKITTWLDEPASDARYIRFVAEEVPSALGGASRGVCYSAITAANTAALKVAKARIEALEATVAQQGALLAAMETRLRALESRAPRELGASAWDGYSRAEGEKRAEFSLSEGEN